MVRKGVNQERRNENEHCGKCDEKRSKKRRKMTKRRKREREENVNGGLKKIGRNMG
jgi:hypothetical protein